MFKPNFTGNARKTRNVNLSGQKPTNPFAKAAAGAGGSRAEAIAKAERERQQRQHDRDIKNAALRIQKLWRGHRVRRDHRESCRARLAQERRPEYAVPLILMAFKASQVQDHVLLCQVVQDLVQTNFDVFRTGLLDPNRLGKLARLIFVVLERSGADRDSQSRASVLLEAFPTIYSLLPPSITVKTSGFYRELARFYKQSGLDNRTVNAIRNAAVAPLRRQGQPDEHIDAAYDDFAFAFLTQPDLPLDGPELDFYASNIDMALLVAVVVEELSQRGPLSPKTREGPEGDLWLLAYLIALKKARNRREEPSNYPEAVDRLLSLCSRRIRAGFTMRAQGSQETLPTYVSDKLAFLTDKDEIRQLVQRLVRHGDGDEDMRSFAGYILSLLNCFPRLGDDIRMRLYLADVEIGQDSVPSIKFLWRVVHRTTIFRTIMSKSEAALDILRYKNRAGNPEVRSDLEWHREWRAVLLFLELYIFVLRLADDDDFFGAINPVAMYRKSPSRLCASSLSLPDLRDLTLFLKHLGFDLYYSPLEIQEESERKRKPWILTSGIEFYAFRGLVATAMKMLYERDSRRPFLPKRHWLMMSKSDTEGFVQAVVLEEKQRRVMQDSTDASDEDDDAYEFPEPQSQDSQQKAARESKFSAYCPRIEVLRNMPFVVPFEARVQIFRQFIHMDKEKRRGGHVDPDQWRLSMQLHQQPTWANPFGAGRNMLMRHSAQIKRGQLFSDAKAQFWDLGESLKEPIQITFVDEFNIAEAGIDGGGVTKEFLTSVTNEALKQNTNLFVANSKNSLYPNPAALDQLKNKLNVEGVQEGSDVWKKRITEFLHQYEFLGRIIGKCMYEGILIDISFAGFFLLKWASAGREDTYRANINDLYELDEELYKGMLKLKNYEGDVADFGTDFTITDQVSSPGEPVRTKTRNLIPNGEEIPVTNENRLLYINYVARHKLLVQPHAQTRAFLRGLSMMIDPDWLGMFNQNELQRLVGGDSSNIDVEDLRRNTIYSGVYEIGTDGQEHPTVKLFWRAMHTLAESEKREVLKYVTSTPRAPLLGFSQLNPPFTIRDGGLDETRLPSASTCVNLLKLPQYRSLHVLRDKLLYAVKSGAGFDLS